MANRRALELYTGTSAHRSERLSAGVSYPLRLACHYDALVFSISPLKKTMLELSLSHEEWRFLQLAMFLSSSYQIWGAAQRLYDKHKARREAQKLKSANQELERLSEQLHRQARQGQGPLNLDQELDRFREEQRRRMEQGEAPQSIDGELQRLRERVLRVRQLQGRHGPERRDDGVAQGDQGHVIERGAVGE